jgi:hypothetical protein
MCILILLHFSHRFGLRNWPIYCINHVNEADAGFMAGDFNFGGPFDELAEQNGLIDAGRTALVRERR